MKAIVCHAYGSPEALKVEEVPKPVPQNREVLIKVKATAINDYDWSMVRGKPYLYRALFGLTKPKNPIPGMELSGIVEEKGPEVSQFQIGDEVYGDTSEYGFGSFAEYLAIDERALVRKPDFLTFEEAAATSHAANLAYQGLITVGKIRKGEKILINGAGGGVGSFGLQIAKTYDLHVTGVDTGDKLLEMKSMGFDKVIDYRQENFTKTHTTKAMGGYDLILDAKTSLSIPSYLRSLKAGGRYVTVGGTPQRLIQFAFQKGFINAFTNKTFHLLFLRMNEELNAIHKLIETGKLKPTIDGPYKFEEIPRLIQYFGEGKHHGKVVISIH